VSTPVDLSLTQWWEGWSAGTPLRFALLMVRDVLKRSAQSFRGRHRQRASNDLLD
jgi:hypothetical protein